LYVRDGADHKLSVIVQPEGWWTVIAASGGHPIPMFGEWDGYDFHLRTLHTDGLYFSI
jgi:hypothetical protein